jgi:hypothetical protein
MVQWRFLPVGAAKVERKTNLFGWFFVILILCSSQKIGWFLCYAPRVRKIVAFYRGRDAMSIFFILYILSLHASLEILQVGFRVGYS